MPDVVFGGIGVIGEELADTLTAAGFIAARADGTVGAAFYMLRINGFYLAFDELSAGEVDD